MKRLGVVAMAVTATLSCQHPTPAPPVVPTPTPAVPAPWARSVLARLSLAEKAAQIIAVRAEGLPRHPSSRRRREQRRWVSELGVGTVVVFDSEVGSLPGVLNELQSQASVPLLVAADLERGLAFRIRRGVVPFPYAMALGAGGSVEDARAAGGIVAREARALGVHWAFAPVADVNNNPGNPVINIRSFGEDAAQVARLTTAFIQGVHAGGVLTTAKHFPGHGDTSVDSHLALATLTGDRARLDAVELLPFRAAIAAGVDAVMVGHLAAPALDPSGAAATYSAAMTTGVLRGELGFHGLVVTDAMEMAGARDVWVGEGVVRAVLAGADLVLLPPEPDVAVAALVRAVHDGRLPEARLDESVLRILTAKERLGLPEERLVDPAAAETDVDRPEDRARCRKIAERSITVVRNQGSVLPLRAESDLHLLHLVLSSDVRNDAIRGIPEEELAARRIPAQTLSFGPEISDAAAEELVARAGEFSHVLVSAFVKVTGSKGTADMSASHARLIRDLVERDVPVVVVSYGSPYLLTQFPEAPVYVCAYGGAESSQRAALAVLLGEVESAGRLPVSLPGLYPVGSGIRMPRRAMTLEPGTPERAGFDPAGLEAVDRIVDGFVAERAFPGAVVAVGKDGWLAHLRAFGRLSYGPDAAPVRVDTPYDLASLTKVMATATMAMILVDEDRLDLDEPVRHFVPGFTGGGRDAVTVRQLLTHSSGLDWGGASFRETHGREALLESIVHSELVYAPGTRSLYSDLGTILLGEVLERVAGEPLDAFVQRRIFEPLGLAHTLFRPPAQMRDRIAPTELDPWRGRLVQGEVHDEIAFAMGGVAPHAGLFGTAGDVARFAQMMLNGGVLKHHRIASRDTVELFTRRAGVDGSSRALGWDTKSEPSSAGTLFSEGSYGHTGFTGTSLWIDPQRRLFLVLLTNRVHPTRDNDRIRAARPAIADAVVRALRHEALIS